MVLDLNRDVAGWLFVVLIEEVAGDGGGVAACYCGCRCCDLVVDNGGVAGLPWCVAAAVGDCCSLS
ncbi:hypothetical protein ACLOJK_038434 [Asimina triloba]